jgi:hypothetical protein
MNTSDKEMNELLGKIDDVELIPDSELENMDFYQLSYYMQTLNQIDALGNTKMDGDDNE